MKIASRPATGFSLSTASMVLALLVAAAPEVEATAVFSANALATLELTPSNGTDLDFFVDPSADDLVFEIGSASGAAASSASPLDMGIDVSGEATGQAAGNGQVEAFSTADGFFVLTNRSMTDAIELSFILNYRIEGSAFIDDFANEDAFGQASIMLEGFGAFDTTILSFEVFADPFETHSDASIITGTLFLPPSGTGELILFADASGFASAESPVSEPGALFLLGLAALGADVLRRRKRRADF